MNMLPNDHHPGPRCSCAECLRKYPEAQPTSKKLCYGVNISSEADALITEYGNANFDCGDYRDDDGDGDGQYLAISNKTAEHGAALAQYVERLQRKVADLELIVALTAQPPTAAPGIAAIRAVIAEMIHIAANGDRDADWTADNCAQIDAWQVRLAEAVAGQAQGEPDGH